MDYEISMLLVSHIWDLQSTITIIRSKLTQLDKTLAILNIN